MEKTLIERKGSHLLRPLGEETPRTKMMAVAKTLDDVILLGRGDPDLDTPANIKAAAIKAIENNKTHYSDIRGMPELRKAIADKLKRDNNCDYNPDNEIIVTCGAQEAVYLTMLGIINPGDEVLVGEPRYNAYDEAIMMAGGVPKVIECLPEEDWLITPERLRAAITPKTKALSLVNPGNPAGFYNPVQIRALAEVVKEKDILVISDEIYENIIFDDTPHLSFAAIPGMKERTITINGPSKSYAMTGWRCGYLAAPAPFCEMMTEATHTLAICCPMPTQYAAIEAYNGPQDSLKIQRDIYRYRRDIVWDMLKKLDFEVVTPHAGFYVFFNVTSTGLDPEEFCMRLLKEERVLIFPGSLFADRSNKYARISLLAPTERVEEATKRIERFVKNLRK